MTAHRPTGPRANKIALVGRGYPAREARSAFGRIFTRLRHLPARLLAILVRWQQRANERAHLRDLDERALRDVGLTRADVEAEAGLPFWQGSSAHRRW